MQVKEHIRGLSPHILLEPHSIWMEKSNNKKLLHLLVRPIIGLGAQTLNKKKINNTWAHSATTKRLQINTLKGYPIRDRSRTRPVPTIHAVSRHQYCLLQDSGSLRKNIRTKQEGSQLHPARATSISWSPIIMTPTPSMQNL